MQLVCWWIQVNHWCLLPLWWIPDLQSQNHRSQLKLQHVYQHAHLMAFRWSLQSHQRSTNQVKPGLQMSSYPQHQYLLLSSYSCILNPQEKRYPVRLWIQVDHWCLKPLSWIPDSLSPFHHIQSKLQYVCRHAHLMLYRWSLQTHQMSTNQVKPGLQMSSYPQYQCPML